MEKGYTIKMTDEELSVDVIGTLTYDESIHLTLLAMKSFMDHTKQVMLASPQPEGVTDEEAEETAAAVLYDKAVVAFSYIMDQFFPKAKELRAEQDGFDEYIKSRMEEISLEVEEIE